MKLQLSPRALEDLQSITAYSLQTWGEIQTDHYLDAIWEALEEIRRCPDRFRLRQELAEGCRSALIGHHVIFFSANDERVAVIRILHSSMDFGQHL